MAKRGFCRKYQYTCFLERERTEETWSPNVKIKGFGVKHREAGYSTRPC